MASSSRSTISKRKRSPSPGPQMVGEGPLLLRWYSDSSGGSVPHSPLAHDAPSPVAPSHASRETTPPPSLSGIRNWTFSKVPTTLKFPLSSAATLYHERIAKKKLSRGRCVKFDSLPPSPAINWVKALQWDRLMEIDDISYPYLVKLFYSNMTFQESASSVSIESTVLGTKLLLTPSKLNLLFNIPNEGSTFFNFGDFTGSGVSLDDVCNLFWKGKHYSLSGGKGLKEMNVDHILLYKLICCSLLSGTIESGGHSTDLSTMSLFLMVKAVRGEPVNLGHLMLKYMIHSFSHSAKNLPYSLLLTHIFRSEQVFLPDAWMEAGRDRKVLDLAALKKMRILHSAATGWTRAPGLTPKAKLKEPVPISSADLSDSSPDIAPSVRRSTRLHTQSHDSKLDDVLTAIRELDVSFRSCEARLTKLSVKVDKLGRRITRVRDSLRKLRQTLG